MGAALVGIEAFLPMVQIGARSGLSARETIPFESRVTIGALSGSGQAGPVVYTSDVTCGALSGSGQAPPVVVSEAVTVSGAAGMVAWTKKISATTPMTGAKAGGAASTFRVYSEFVSGGALAGGTAASGGDEADAVSGGALSGSSAASSFTPGATGGAIVLNGTNQYALIPFSATLSNTGPFTAAVWFNAANNSQTAHVMTRWRQGSSGNYCWYNGYFGGAVGSNVAIGCITGNTIGVSSAVSDLTWHHLCQTWDGTTMTCYIDGSSIGTASNAMLTCNSWTNQGLGAAEDGGLPFTGKLTAHRYYDACLTALQVSEIYGAGSGLATAGSASANLMLWLKINEGSGTVLNDSSGNGNTGSTVNKPTWTTSTILG